MPQQLNEQIPNKYIRQQQQIFKQFCGYIDCMYTCGYVNEHKFFRNMSSEMHYNKYNNHAEECRMFRVGK